MREYCPKCSKLQDLNQSESTRKGKNEKGETIKIVTKSYQCHVCQSFIRSEDIEIEIQE